MRKAIWLFVTAIAYGQPGGSGDGIWVRDAYFGERQTFDSCVGHQPQNGEYHHHAGPICLRFQLGDNVEILRNGRAGATYRELATPVRHSPILGWAIDGYPIYGPYGYAEPRNAASPLRRMRSGYRLRQMNARTSLPDWALPLKRNVAQQLTQAQYGPAINAEFPLGRYIEDYEWVANLGDLDIHNGRFAVTPEYPQGTYAYYITINAQGVPEFPYILGGQYYGVTTNANAPNVPTGAVDYFQNGAYASPLSSDPLLQSWATAKSQQDAAILNAFSLSAGAQNTWPGTVPPGFRTSGSVTTPAKADTQRIRMTDSTVYINASGLASYVMGPWFDPLMTGGIFGNFPSSRNLQVQFTRSPREASTKSASGLGTVGLWVNGVAVFNYLDGASYSAAQGTDVGGGMVRQSAVHVSSASAEPGPVTPNSLISAYSLFGSILANGSDCQVSVRDSAGTTRNAEILYASAGQVNYRMPDGLSNGAATVTISSAGKSYAAGAYVTSTYPHIFIADVTGLAATQSTRAANGEIYLTFYGSGRGNSQRVTAQIGGRNAMVAYAGAQGQFTGLDQYNIVLPPGLPKGRATVEITVDGVQANPVFVVVD